MRARMIDPEHLVHAGRTGLVMQARQDKEAVEMGGPSSAGRPIVLEHVPLIR